MISEDQQFAVFKARFEVFIAMEEADAFSVGWGKVTLNWAAHELQSVVREEVAWKRP